MNDPLPTAPISPLRQRLIDDMNMRRFSPETQRNYIRCNPAPVSDPLGINRLKALRRRSAFGPGSD